MWPPGSQQVVSGRRDRQSQASPGRQVLSHRSPGQPHCGLCGRVGPWPHPTPSAGGAGPAEAHVETRQDLSWASQAGVLRRTDLPAGARASGAHRRPITGDPVAPCVFPLFQESPHTGAGSLSSRTPAQTRAAICHFCRCRSHTQSSQSPREPVGPRWPWRAGLCSGGLPSLETLVWSSQDSWLGGTRQKDVLHPLPPGEAPDRPHRRTSFSKLVKGDTVIAVNLPTQVGVLLLGRLLLPRHLTHSGF